MFSFEDFVPNAAAKHAMAPIDDLHVLASKPATQTVLAGLVRGWLDEGMRIACAAGCSPIRLPDFTLVLPPPPAARFVRLPRPRRRAAREIITGIARRSGIAMEREMVNDLATWCAGDVRRVVGALRQLQFGESIPSTAPSNP